MPDVNALRQGARDDPAMVRRRCREALEKIHLARTDRLGLLQALGWAELELGDLVSADRANVRAAELLHPGDEDAIEVGYLSGVVKIAQGRPELADDALRSIAASLAAKGRRDGRIEMALAIILAEARQPDAAFIHYSAALELAESTGDSRQIERILNNRAILSMQMGRFDESRNDLTAARELAASRETLDVIAVIDHNLGALSARRGDLPAAIQQFESARGAMDSRSTHVIGPALVDEAQLLLDAGLLDEARQRAIEAAALYADAGAPAREIGAIFLIVRACVAQSRFAQAAAHAQHASAVATEAAFEPSAVHTISAVSDACSLLGSDEPHAAAVDFKFEVTPTWIPSVGDIAVELGIRSLLAGSANAARSYFEHVLHDVSSPSALDELDRRVASCGLATLDGDFPTVLQVASDGLAAATSNAIALGVTEFRTMASRRLRQVASLGVAAALDLEDPAGARRLLEQTRAIEFLPEPHLSRVERSIVAQLRRTVALLGSPNLAAQARIRLLTEQGSLEGDLRSHRRRTIASKPRTETTNLFVSTPNVPIDLHIVGDRVCALIGTDATMRVAWLGNADRFRSATAKLALALSANAHERSQIRVDRFVSAMAELLGPVLTAVRSEPMAEVVVDPQLGEIPWSLLTETPVAVLRSHRHSAEVMGRPSGKLDSIGIVVGPGLQGAEIEASLISEMYADVTVLRGQAATADAVQQLLRDVDLIHFAAHGRFRADNPLMSHLEMSLGPISFMDLMEPAQLPERMIFSACHLGSRSAGTSAVGLSGLLLDRGCQGFIAAGGPTNDLASAKLMTEVHCALQSDPDKRLASALRHAQSLVGDSPSMARYLAFGAG